MFSSFCSRLSAVLSERRPTGDRSDWSLSDRAKNSCIAVVLETLRFFSEGVAEMRTMRRYIGFRAQHLLDRSPLNQARVIAAIDRLRSRFLCPLHRREDRGNREVPIEDKRENFDRLRGHISVVYPSFELSHYESIESFLKEGHPFHFAVQKSDLDLLKLLVESGADINQTDENGNTAVENLMQKNRTKKYEIFGRPLLVETGVSCEDRRMIDYLVDRGARVGGSRSAIERLIGACIEKDEDWVSVLLGRVIGEKNSSAIVHALMENSKLSHEVMEYLIDEGLDVDTTDREGRSLLYRAVSKMDSDLVEGLVDRKANPRLARSREGMGASTPLDLAQAKKRELETLVSKKIPLKRKAEAKLKKCNQILLSLRKRLDPLIP